MPLERADFVSETTGRHEITTSKKQRNRNSNYLTSLTI